MLILLYNPYAEYRNHIKKPLNYCVFSYYYHVSVDSYAYLPNIITCTENANPFADIPNLFAFIPNFIAENINISS